jgi:hypothetical protein
MRHLCLLPLLSLAACATAQPDPLIVPPADGGETAATCRADALAAFTGKTRSEALGTQILAATGAAAIRWVEPGTMVTMEFRADRVTVHLDAANRVERAACT